MKFTSEWINSPQTFHKHCEITAWRGAWGKKRENFLAAAASPTCQGSTRTVRSLGLPPEISADTGWHSCPCCPALQAAPQCDASSLRSWECEREVRRERERERERSCIYSENQVHLPLIFNDHQCCQVSLGTLLPSCFLTELLQGGGLHLRREILHLQEALVGLLGSPVSLLTGSESNSKRCARVVRHGKGWQFLLPSDRDEMKTQQNCLAGRICVCLREKQNKTPAKSDCICRDEQGGRNGEVGRPPAYKKEGVGEERNFPVSVVTPHWSALGSNLL